MAAISKTERILNLVSYLLKSRTPVPWEEIKGKVVGYDDPADSATLERRFERDKQFLRSLGIPIEFKENEFGQSGYVLEKDSYFLPRIDISAEEAAMLGVLRQLFPSEPAELGNALQSALRKICFDAPSPSDFATTLEEYHLIGGRGVQRDSLERRNLGTLMQAILQNKRVSFDYYGIARDEVMRRHVDPYGMGFTGGAWYLVGLCHTRNEVRVFKVSRIRGRVKFCNPRSQGGEFALPEDFRLKDYLGLPPWELRRVERVKVRIRFDDIAGWIAAADTLGEGEFKASKDGSGVLTLHITDEDAFVRWVLRFTTHAVVLSPARIRRKVAEQIRAVEKLYRGKERAV